MSQSPKLTVLVTGAAGMLGAHIVEELLFGTIAKELDVGHIRVFDKQLFIRLGEGPGEAQCGTLTKQVPTIEIIQGDITDKEAVAQAVQGCDVVIHACSMVDFGNLDAQIILNVNVQGTRHVVDACRAEGSRVRALIYTSTFDTCWPKPSRHGELDVDDSIDPLTVEENRLYGSSKRQAELVCLEQNQINSLVIRPLAIYGQRSAYHIDAECRAALALGKMNKFKIGLGDSVMQTVYAGNVAHLHLCAVKALLSPNNSVVKACVGKTFFATDDTPVCNFFAFGEPYVKAKGYTIATIAVPYVIMFLAAAVGELVNNTLLCVGLGNEINYLTRESVIALCTSFSASGAQARDLLAYTPIYTPQEAFEKTRDYFVALPNLPQGPVKYPPEEYSKPTPASPKIVLSAAREFRVLTILTRCFMFFTFWLFFVTYLMPYSVTIGINMGWQTVGPSAQVPVSLVYDTLYDFEKYGTWNTFTDTVTTQNGKAATVGSLADLHVNLRMPGTTSQILEINNEFEFVEITPNVRICWAYQIAPKPIQRFVLVTRRCMEVKEMNGFTMIRHFDINSGPMAPLVELLFTEPIVEGFDQMTHDLKKHLKQLP
eukprot:m.176964 g.176964  ORF g.176964 m.176964 type:complete len:599 (-) comp31866_c0_seq2:36-1832(-)